MTISTSKVSIGHQGYLFLAGDTNNIAAQLTGSTRLSEQDIANIARAHTERNALSKNTLGATYLPCVIPAKEIIFKNYLPYRDDVHKFGPRPYIAYKQSIAQRIAPIEYFEEVLSKPNSLPTHPKQDSHWNHTGALLYIQAVLEKINPEYATILRQQATEEKQIELQGDLGSKINLSPEKNNLH